ncbi:MULTISPECIES: glucan biosynthesis protein [Rhodomicrobium]|uniref:glucan biosynthesis protein n=1 Tax=Rhodomicrobium TaxID=1068 RepID=UPI000B4ACFD2|nr:MULTISPECIES: glucan biosynthesis protein [Rhodomicrobium]
MNRRAFLMAAGLGSLAAALGRSGLAALAETGPATDFSWDILKAKAKALAGEPYRSAAGQIAPALADLNYDQFRNIEFDSDKAIWSGTQIPFRMELFHNGYIYRDPMDIYLVENGKAAPIRYDKSMFNFGPAEQRVPLPDDAGFSGLRLHAPVHEPNVFEEFQVFQGASYFRGKAMGQTYGLSARGLAINTAREGGEEFPSFRAFWVETSAADSHTVTVYALLDSDSVAGAYRFVIGRAVDVVMDVDCAIYPRKAIQYPGIAPFSSMFFFGPADHTPHDDFRPRVHDSDGLLLLTGEGNWIWRPLVTAPQILYSVFSDKSPRGFGLMQRQRDFDHYQDINAAYERRPSAWVEPLSDWGDGSVDLIELPTGTEYADNIVAFWRPKDPLQAGGSYDYRYRLTWCWHVPGERPVAQVLRTRSGVGLPPGSRYIMIDFAGGELYADADDEHWDYDVTASAGYIKAYTIAPNPFTGGKRVGIEYHPDGSKEADLAFQISRFGKKLTEKWVYRWAP